MLALRFVVLLTLIAQAAWIYLRLVADGRGIWQQRPESLVALQERFARRFVRIAVREKGGLIKLGQVASLRVDILADEVSAVLSSLQDRVAPRPAEAIVAQIEAELGRPVDTAFASFDRNAIAAASLGQVHEATLPDGERVAVKVLYPGVERSVAVDLAAARIALWLFDWVVTPDLNQVYRELERSLRGEMDYEREADAADEVRANLARDPAVAARVRIPAIHRSHSAKRVLTMEFIDGVKINELAAHEANGVDLRELVTWATRAFLHMIFRDGFFHCDPHPGNLLVDAEGRIGIIDFGMNQRLDPRVMKMMRDNVMATVQRDETAYARSLLDGGVIRAEDLPVVEEIARVTFDPAYYNLTPKELAQVDFATYLREMRGHLKRLRHFRLPDGLVMWSRAVTLLMGLATELAPGIRPVELVGPYMMGFLSGLYEPGAARDAPEVEPAG